MSKPYDGKQWTLRDFSSDITIIDQGRRPNNIIFVLAYDVVQGPTLWRIYQWHPELENDTDRAMRAFLDTMAKSHPSVDTMRNALHTYVGLLP